MPDSHAAAANMGFGAMVGICLYLTTFVLDLRNIRDPQQILGTGSV